MIVCKLKFIKKSNYFKNQTASYFIKILLFILKKIQMIYFSVFDFNFEL